MDCVIFQVYHAEYRTEDRGDLDSNSGKSRWFAAVRLLPL